MAITYHAGRRIQGLSTDIVETLTFEDDFSSDNFTHNGENSVSGGVLNWEGERDGTVDSSVYNYGSVINTAILRAKITIDSFGQPSATSHKWHFGFSDSNQSVGGNTSQDFVGFMFVADGGGSSNIRFIDADGTAPANEADIGSISTTPSATTYYVEIILNGDGTAKGSIFSDSNYSTLTETTGNVSISATALQYIKCMNNENTSQTGGSLNGTLDDLVFYNGVSSLTSKPTNVQSGSRFEETDTRKIYYGALPSVTFEDDFSSYADQTAFDASWVTSNTAKFRGNPSNDNVDILTSNSYDNIYYDLTSVSDTKWLCRFKVTLTTAGSQSLGICYFYIGTTIGDANESQSGLGFYFYDNNNNTYATADNGNRPDQTSVVDDLGINPSTTTYYAEMKRTSATSFTVTLYSDSSYSTSLGTATLTISSGITGLRYFKIMGYNTTGGLVGTLDDFKFYNGATSTDFTWTEEV